MQATAAAKKANGPKKTSSAKGTRTATAEKRASVAAPASGERHQNEGHGRRLTMAFEALEAFPALAESRNRLLSVIAKDNVATADVVAAVESDVALVIAVLRLANRADERRRPGRHRRRRRRAAQPADRAGRSPTACAPSTSSSAASVWDAAPERFRLHALATQHAADRLATEVGYENRDRLIVTSLLHDVGKLVLMHAYPGYPSQVHREARTPEERVHRERRELGVDHALVGGVLTRRWGLPKSIADADRAPPRRRGRRRGRVRPPRRHARPLRAGRPGLPDRDAARARAVGSRPAASCAA